MSLNVTEQGLWLIGGPGGASPWPSESRGRQLAFEDFFYLFEPFSSNSYY
jgi:hypothetical protein